jgi:hypothetical protein
MEQTRDDWLWDAGLDTEYEPEEQTGGRQKKEEKPDLAKELDAVKQQLQMWQTYMWQQYWTNMVNEAISQVLRQKPYLQAWVDELKGGLAQDVATWWQQKQSEGPNINWDDVSKFLMEALQKRAEGIEAKLAQIGFNPAAGTAPVTLPGSGAVPPGSERRAPTEETPGYGMSLGNDMEFRIVPPGYLEELTRKQREEYIRDILAMQQKRRQGGILPRGEIPTQKTE